MPESRQLDLVVVGGGPAGLAAAAAAAEHGKQVLVIDQAPRLGGQIWRHREGDGLPDIATRLLHDVQPPRVAVAHGASVIDALAPTRIVVDFGGRVAVVETSALVLATGAMERLLPFPGWTLPGVVGVGGLQALLKEGAPLDGKRVVIAGTGPLLWPVADAVVRHGGRLVAIAEQVGGGELMRFGVRLLRRPPLVARAVSYRRTTWRAAFHTGSWPLRAEGEGELRSVTLRVGSGERRYDVDWLAAAAGLLPRIELGQLLGCRIEGGALAVDARQATSVSGVWAAGECTGISGDDGACAEGTIAGLAAIGVAEIPERLVRRRQRAEALGRDIERTFAPRPELRGRVTPETLICRCENVPAGVIDPTWDFRQAKLWTRLGMGACQGRVCGAACHFLYGWKGNAVRPPLEPPALGSWGRALSPATPPSTSPTER